YSYQLKNLPPYTTNGALSPRQNDVSTGDTLTSCSGTYTSRVSRIMQVLRPTVCTMNLSDCGTYANGWVIVVSDRKSPSFHLMSNGKGSASQYPNRNIGLKLAT